MAEEIHVYPVEDVFHEFAPYFVEQVRKDVVQRYGNPTLLHGGLKVFTTMDSEKQRAAQEAMLGGLLQVDKRQGFRGPVMTPRDARAAEGLRRPEREGAGGQADREQPVLRGAGDRGRTTPGSTCRWATHKGVLPLLGMRWARKVNPEAYYPGAMLTSAKKVVKPGDVIVVRCGARRRTSPTTASSTTRSSSTPLPENVQLFRLEQEPELAGRAGLHRPPSPVPVRDGGRLRLRRQRVQPRLPGLPPAGQQLQAAGVLGGDGEARLDRGSRHRRQPHRRERPRAPGPLEARELHRGLPWATCSFARRS